MRFVGLEQVERQEICGTGREGKNGNPCVAKLVAHRSDGSIAAARYHEVVFGGILEQWRKFSIRPERADGNGVALLGVTAYEVIYRAVAEARA